MPSNWPRLIVASLLAIHVVVTHGREPIDADKLDFFETKIRPVLVEHCYECHSSQSSSVEGELRLDSRDTLLAGGATGRSFVAGDANSSLLVKALRYDDLKMPPERRLSDEVVKDFERWINDGAVDPRIDSAPRPEASNASIDWNEAREFWSLKSPVQSVLPVVLDMAWPQTRIDHFILAEIEANSMTASSPADRYTLARRTAFDLTGLPPSFDEVESFLTDDAPDALPRFVDQLMASTAFGERFARMWLDLARYAEDQAHIVGDDRSLCYPNAFMYRDWVIEAFNNDLPYDSFVRQQLAADQVDGPVEPDLRPLGFLGVGPKYYQRGSAAVMADEWEDRVDVVTRGLLGLTVACARCHDHKYDPIPTKDYYALAGVFASTQMFNMPLKPDAEKKDSGEAKKAEESLHIVRDGKPQDLQIALRGDVKRKGDLAPRRFLQVIASEQSSNWGMGKSSGRRELAEAIAQPTNPLLARVFVNRVWGALIGKPLVATPSNFGRLGSPPSHPELLDDLAVRFMQSNWSLKWLIREIVLSSTYQQSSLAQSSLAQASEVDPENVWVARMNRKRLSIEGWRDALLASSGNLQRTVGGPSINPQNPDEHRRTLYSEISRLEVNKMLSLFDFPDPNAHAERRANTTTALQKLFVLNSSFMLAQARGLSSSVGLPLNNPDEGGLPSNTNIRVALDQLYRRVLARSPREDEAKLMTDYLTSGLSTTDIGQLQSRWVEVSHVLLASNELLFID